MSEFDDFDTRSTGFASAGSSDTYELTGPPKILPSVSTGALLIALLLTLVLGDSVVAFGIAVLSCLLTLASRAQNQTRMNQPSYSASRWFGIATSALYVVASLAAFAQVLMVAYVAGR